MQQIVYPASPIGSTAGRYHIENVKMEYVASYKLSKEQSDGSEERSDGRLERREGHVERRVAESIVASLLESAPSFREPGHHS